MFAHTLYLNREGGGRGGGAMGGSIEVDMICELTLKN